MAEACQNGLGGKTDETTPRKRPLCSRLCVGELVELFPRVVGGGLAVFRRERGTTVAAEVDAVADVEGVDVVDVEVRPSRFGESRRLQFGFGHRIRTWCSRKMMKTAPVPQKIQTRLPRDGYLVRSCSDGIL